MDAGLGCGLVGDGEKASLRDQRCDRRAVFRDEQGAALEAVVGAATLGDRLQGNCIPRALGRLAGDQRGDQLGAPGRRARDADDHHREAEMREGHAAGRARQAGKPAQGVGRGGREQPDAAAPFGERADSQPGGEPHGKRCEGGAVGHRQEGRDDGGDSRDRGGDELVGRRAEVPAFPGQEGPHRDQQHQWHHDRAERRVEEGRADGDAGLAARQCLEDQRIERAEQHGRGRDGQQHVVRHQRALAARRREQAAPLHAGRAHGKQRERPADRDGEDGQDEDPALGVGREGVH